MTQDDAPRSSSPRRPGESHGDPGEALEEATDVDRLLPPAFPPRERQAPRHRPATGRAVEDEPAESDLPEDAIIAPDAPLPPRHRLDDEDAEDLGLPPWGEEEGVATGIGDSDLAYPMRTLVREPELDAGGVASLLEELARGLRTRGATALLVDSDSTRLEAMLRGFLAGYLLRGGK